MGPYRTTVTLFSKNFLEIQIGEILWTSSLGLEFTGSYETNLSEMIKSTPNTVAASLPFNQYAFSTRIKRITSHFSCVDDNPNAIRYIRKNKLKFFLLIIGTVCEFHNHIYPFSISQLLSPFFFVGELRNPQSWRWMHIYFRWGKFFISIAIREKIWPKITGWINFTKN